MSAIFEWLGTYGLQTYARVFEENQIGTDILHTLTDADLKELGVPLGDRKRLLEACSKSPAARLGRRQITVVICDLVDSTPLSENTDAEIFRECLQAFRSVCKNSIEKFNGYIYQYRGDAAIAYFGYPVGQEKSALRACHAALDVKQGLAQLESAVELRARIGIATGTVVVGAEVEQGAIQENAVGVTPNLAARLQALGAPGEIILCPLTHTLIEDSFETRSLGPQPLKGIRESVPAFSLQKPIDKALLHYIPKNRQKTPLTGRHSELVRLAALWKSESRPLKFVMLRGEAGVGKSRVIHEFSQSSHLENSIHIQLFCSSFNQNSALYPVIAQLRRFMDLQATDSDEDKLDKIRGVLKEYHCSTDENLGTLASLLGIKMPANPIEALQPHERRKQYFQVIGELLRAQSRIGNLLIVIEDAQWIDPTTQGLLTQLVDPDFGLTCTLLLSARTEYNWPESAAVKPEIIDLRPLDKEESEQLVRSAMNSGRLSEELIHDIVNLTDGIPLYIEETTRAVTESVSSHTGTAHTDSDTLRVSVPPTLQESLMARLDGLGTTRDTALAASVIGREFSRKLLQLSLNESAVNVQRDLNILVENGTLRARETQDGVKYQFNHGLLQNIAYDSLLNSARMALHSQIANALLIHFQNAVTFTPELVAYHLGKAERQFEAAGHWKKAGLLASQRGSLQETVVHYQAALDALDSLEQTVELARMKVSILSGLAATLLATTSYRSPEVRVTADRALSLCKEHGLTLEIAPFLYDIWLGEQGDGKHASALDFAIEFLEMAEQQTESEARMVANRAVAWSKFNLGDPNGAITHLSRSKELYEQNIHRDLVLVYGTDHLVGVGCGQVQAEWCAGLPDTALQTSVDTIKAARQSGHVVSEFLAYQYAGCLLHTLLRNWEKTGHYAASLIQLGKDNDFPQAILAGNIYQYAMQLRAEKDHAFYESGTKIIESTQKLGYLYMMPYWFMVLADACLDAGLLAEADKCLITANDIIDNTSEVWHLPEIYRLRGQLLAQRSNDADAASADWFNKAVEESSRQGANGWLLRAATSLCQWQARRGEAQDVAAIRTLIAKLNEGFETPDYRRAMQLIDA